MMRPAAHHRLIIRELERVARGDVKRLMLTLPPGSAKSTYASDLFPAWWLAHGGNRSIIAASNTADLAELFSRRVRARVRDWGQVLGYALDREAESLWTTTHGGQYRAAGVGGTITGMRADLVLIDDPVKSREEADSERVRDKVWEWYQADLLTRLRPNGAVIVIMTRWHEDDLAGRILEREAPLWRVLRIPAEAEDADDPLGRKPGELLWDDDAYGYARALRERKPYIDARTWSALYQQRPAPDEGAFFRREWFRFGEPPPLEVLRIVGASDYAVTADGGDWTVHLVGGVDNDGRVWLLDHWRAQADTATWIEAWCDLVVRWKPLEWAEEGGQIRAGVGPFIEARQRARAAWTHRVAIPARADKPTRAQAIRGRMSLDGLWIPRGAPWAETLLSECLAFPAGKHDDQVDALALLGQLLLRMESMRKPKPPPEPPLPPGVIRISDLQPKVRHGQERV